MAKHKWTSLEQAQAYITAHASSKARGLKYCSAVSFVANYGKLRCTNCGCYHHPSQMVLNDEDGNNVEICKPCYQRFIDSKKSTEDV